MALEGAANIAEEALLAEDPAAARAAFERQAATLEHRPHLRLMLARMESRLVQLAERDRRRLKEAVQNALTPTTLESLTEADRELQSAAQALLRFAFDDKQYAVPAKAHTGWVPGVDIQPGQEAMEKRYAAAYARYETLQAQQHACLLALIAALEPGAEQPYVRNPQPPLPPYLQKIEQMRQSVARPIAQGGRLPDSRPVVMYALLAPDRTAAELLKLLRERAQGLRMVAHKIDQLRGWQAELTPSNRRAAGPAATDRSAPAGLPNDDERLATQPFADLPPPVLALVALAEEQYELASRQANGVMPAGFGAFWQSLCDHAALVHNAAQPDLREHEQWGLREINLYRLSLGLRPLIHNDRLQTTAQKHGERMRDRKFFGHFDPDADRKTPQLRAWREGYVGITGENIAGGQDGWRSLWRWRSDAGHHRVMILPYFCEAGLAEVSDNETLNTGAKPVHFIQKLFEKPVSSAETTLPSDPTFVRLAILP